MSKVISAGIRLGYVSGPHQLVQQIMLHNQVSVMHTPTFCQVNIVTFTIMGMFSLILPVRSDQILILQLLKQWGREGFQRHVAAIQEFYIKQRDAMIAAAETHLTGYIAFSLYIVVSNRNLHILFITKVCVNGAVLEVECFFGSNALD